MADFSPGVIGRPVAVVVDHAVVAGIVIDAMPDYARPKRVRVRSGEHAGEVKQPTEYQLVRFMDADGMCDAKEILGRWAEEALA